ncbi:hypothetical protein [Saccharopolyspora phatthalungensis]|uniref:Uncharacterized protein n=1 Tax=Saccharopolyspora phatthalungensis TaxID=664693 RepID=A0A840Q9I8_9PSEU|nr:hypothetical protein [Saccharopolyspora phatthalungensis]MBB5157434.1 hypothetical protein [Saccharopolyspora phatthalungensis]
MEQIAWKPGQRVATTTYHRAGTGTTTGRTTVNEFPEGQLRVEVRMDDGRVLWSLERVLRLVNE